jgi:hypothetical protein
MKQKKEKNKQKGAFSEMLFARLWHYLKIPEGWTFEQMENFFKDEVERTLRKTMMKTIFL